MSKFSDFLKKKSKQFATAVTEEFSSDAPNKFLQPFQHQQWKIIGNLIEFRENSYMGAKPRPFLEFANRYGRSWSGLIGFSIIVILFILAFVIPFTTNSPTELRPNQRYLNYFTDGFIFGTDDNGRDLWAMLWWGLRYSLGIAIVVTIIDLVVGVTIGILMGYFNFFDKIMTFIIKILTNVPTIIILMILTIILKPSFGVMIFAISFSGWTGMANQMRSQVRRARGFLWVSASKTLGTKPIRILWNFVPIIIPLMITQLVFSIPGAILAESSLAFIGLSLPNTPTLGNLIADGATIITLYPRFTLIPSFLLVCLVASIQLVGGATQEALRRQR
ncbi:peptide ABC transporter permease [Ureaplasma diversum]|uniref:Oligopeptide ABC transporter, permease protein n=2 Tax=Ureaplasma diversum TaxID=42094 RepID=A0A084F1H6_9BACT|nr:ABC transporter permease [Ureaplasma diversum]AJQ45109.1 peptide ABC transporter permease [Ureaplasma diversum]KEZ24068.1 Oligopeptide ABC transporter, permease protein [Ureaplasma diversum NCTC 246]